MKRKTSTASKRLPTPKEFKEVASVATKGRSLSKEVSHPPIPKTRVKTKVETSKSQTFVSSLKGISSIFVSSPAQGFLGSSTMIPCSLERLFRHTRNKRKIDVDPVEREREGQNLTPIFSLSLSHLFSSFPFLLFVIFILFFYLQKYMFFLQSKHKVDPKRVKSPSSGNEVV